MTIDTTALFNLLISNGIPVISVTDKTGTEAGITVVYDQSATELQIAQSYSIMNNFIHPLTDQDINLNDVKSRWVASQIHGKTPAQIYTAMQNAIDGWGSLAAAKADLRVWLPLLAAALAWSVFKDQQ